jgi:pimeloyl-ACP methyl ester carboxylesterase
MRIIVRVILGLLVFAILTLAAGWGYQRIAETRDNERYPPPGTLHSVNGRLMHIHCRGTGSPTVIVEQGIGGPSLDWSVINDQMGQVTRVCDYDRAGMGYSEPSFKPTRATDVAKDLNALLASARIDDGLVFVAWSAGGIYAKEFHRQFPTRVKGMVLVDSTHEQTVQRMPPQPSNQENLDNLRRTYYLAQVGWVRLKGEVPYRKAPVSEKNLKRLRAFFLKSHTYHTLVDEGVGLEQDLASGMKPPNLGDMPLVVIAEGGPTFPYMVDNLAQWHALQQELADLSTDGHLVIAKKSAHFIHRSEPELILEAVRDVVAAVRSGQPISAAAVPAP